MKNSTLLLRSLAIILIIAGSAHWASYGAQSSKQTSTTEYDVNTNVSNTAEEKEAQPDTEVSSKNYNEETDYIIGTWKVTYNSSDFKGAIIYKLKKEGGAFSAYTYQYQDSDGNTQRAENTKTLTIKNFNGYTGKGVYTIEYEQQQYQVECQIDMVDENTFKLSYDYYGYSDVETWKRQ